MAPSKDFKKALDEALASITPIENASETSNCPEAETVVAHIRGLSVDDAVGQHVASCETCGQIAADTKRRQKIYERQKAEFTAMAGKKYSTVPVLRETFRPFAWMLQWKAVVAEGALAVVAILIFVPKLHFSSQPEAGGTNGASDASSTFMQIEQSESPAASKALLDKLDAEPQLVGQIDASRVAQARSVVDQKRAAANNNALADQWQDVDGKLQAYEFIAHYNSLRKQTEGSEKASRVADVEGKNGYVTIRFDQNPISDSQDSKILSTSAVETRGLNQVTILAPNVRWQLDSKDDFSVAAAPDSRKTEKQQ
jgi:ribosomal protein L35AE/L33A